MRTFKRLTLRGFPFFKEQSFELNANPLTVITGLNLEGVTKRAGGPSNTNFTGKSLFFSQLRDLFFPSGASGKAKDKIRTGEVELDIDVGKTAFNIVRYGKGKGDRFRITKNGKDATPDAAGDQAAYVARILGMSQDTYEVTYYLDHLKPHALRTGDTAQRKAFFTEFFELYAADEVRKKISTKRSEIRRDSAVLVELREQLKAIPEDDGATIQASLDKWQGRVTSMTNLLEALRERRELHEFRTQHVSGLSYLEEQHCTSVKMARQKLASMEASAKAGREALSNVRAQARYAVEVEAYEKALRAQKAALDALALEDYADLEGKTEILHRRLKKAEAELLAARAENTTADHAYAKWMIDYRDAVQATRDAKSDLLELKERGPNGTCATCGQETTNEHFAGEVAAAEKKVKAGQAKVTALKAHEAEHQEASKTLTEKLSIWEGRFDLVTAKLEVYEKVPETPEEPQRPEGFTEGSVTPAKLQVQLDKLTPKITALQDLLDESVRPMLLQHFGSTDEPYSNEEWDRISDKLRKAQVSVGILESRQSALFEAVTLRESLTKRIAELEESVKDTEAINVLYKAFTSNTGVKTLQIRSTCAILEAQVNKMAAQLFPNPYTFRFDLDKQFTLDVTRTVGKKEVTSDVRKLSGAEAGLFDLLLSISLMSFLPESKRCNLLIMDEIDANFGPSVSQVFVNFLPKLAQMVPNILIITPKETNYGSDAVYHTVVHRAGLSKILTGRRRAQGVAS
jgi:DNA repair exonuclease SbcCD ATPase subunit